MPKRHEMASAWWRKRIRRRKCVSALKVIRQKRARKFYQPVIEMPSQYRVIRVGGSQAEHRARRKAKT